jgi:hypothetical protein
LIDDFPRLSKLSKEELGKMGEGLRNGVMKWWKKKITMEVGEYLYLKYGVDWKSTTTKDNPELGKDRAAIADVLGRVYHCSYWDWHKGITLFFW